MQSNNEELVCYVFVHGFLRQIHQGIQAAHAAVELVTKNSTNPLVKKWASTDKTLILLDGGNTGNMSKLYDLLHNQTEYPVSFFCEDYETLGRLLTAVAVVVRRDDFYQLREYPDATPSDILLSTLNNARLVQ
jgi:hypothetical protein